MRIRRKRALVSFGVAALVAAAGVCWHLHVTSVRYRARRLLSDIELRSGGLSCMDRALIQLGSRDRRCLDDDEVVDRAVNLHRSRVIDDLVALGPPAVPVLVRFLNDPDRKVRVRAIRALAEIGDERALEPLVAALKHLDWKTRICAAYALGQLGDGRAVAPLVAALNSDDSSGLRRPAAQALGWLGGRRAVDALTDVLKDDEVSICAGMALGRLGDRRAVQPLIAALKDHRNATWAAHALGKIGDPRAIGPLVDRLARRHPVGSQAVIQALARLGAAEALIEALKHDNLLVRYHVAKKLGALGDPRAVEPLKRLLEDPHADIRWIAGKAIRKLKAAS